MEAMDWKTWDECVKDSVCIKKWLWIQLGGGVSSHLQKPSNACKHGQRTLKGDEDDAITSQLSLPV